MLTHTTKSVAVDKRLRSDLLVVPTPNSLALGHSYTCRLLLDSQPRFLDLHNDVLAEYSSAGEIARASLPVTSEPDILDESSR